MTTLKSMGGIPLFTTIEEAMAWAEANGLKGYHTHTFNGVVGYMGGVNHAMATGQNINTLPQQPIQQQQQQQQQQVQQQQAQQQQTPATTLRFTRGIVGGGGSGSGGGGGY